MKNKVIIILFVLVGAGILVSLRIRSNIQNYSTSHRVMIYTKEECGYCVMAKNFLSNKNIHFTNIDISHNYDLHAKLLHQTGQKTVPYVFINDKFIGGFIELSNLELE